MALDDILKDELLQLGGATGNLKGTRERILRGEGPSDRGGFSREAQEFIIQYAGDGSPLRPDELALMRSISDEERENALSKYLKVAYEKASEKLIAKVSQDNHYQTMIGEMSGQPLLEVALSIPLSGLENKEEYGETVQNKQEYEVWQSKLDEGNIEFYIQNSNPVIQEILKTKKKNQVKEFMETRVNYHRSKFVSEFITDPEEFEKAQKRRDPKAIDATIDSEKLKAYLGRVVEDIEDANKTKAYEEIGIMYSAHLANHIQEQQNEAYRQQVA